MTGPIPRLLTWLLYLETRVVRLDPRRAQLSLQAQTDTVTINGRAYVTHFEKGSPDSTVTTTTPESRQTVTTLDVYGRVKRVQPPGAAPTDFAYDAQGRLHSVTQAPGSPNPRVWTFAYDTAGNLASVADPLSQVIGFEYDLAARVKKQVLADLREIRFDYDASGNTTAIQPPGRPQHFFDYSPIDLETVYAPPALVPPLSSTNTYELYNPDRQLQLVARPDDEPQAEEHVVYDYDPVKGHLASQTLPGGEQIAYGYDAATGQLTSIDGPGNQSLDFAYQGSLLTSTTWSGEVNGTVTRTYDSDFRVATEQVNAETPVVYAYDADGLIEQVTKGPAALAVQLDPTAPRILGTTLGVVSDQYTYDPVFGEVATYHAEANGAPLLDISYTRDALGRIHTKTESVQGGTPITYEYVYDASGRLHQVKENGSVVSEYDYDLNGNRTGGFNAAQGSISATYDEQDRLLQYTTTARGLMEYTYTANGELASKTDFEGTTTYTYDANGNLRHVEVPNGDLIDYVVDGMNRRIGKKVNGAWVQRFLYRDQLDPVAEFDVNGAVMSEFAYATNAHSPDFMVKNGAIYRIITDRLGSARFVVDVSSGAIAEQISYDEFGGSSVAPVSQPFAFAGGQFDSETGFTRFGARDYDAETGRWLAKDLIRFYGGDSNLYGYVVQNPVNAVDPTGGGPTGAAAGALIGGGIGGAVGGLGGGALCTVVAPGVGTITCGGGGAAEGAAIGAAMGASIGSLAEDTCTSSDDADHDCGAILESCRSRCLDIYVDNPGDLPGSGHDFFGRIRRCIRECMETQGCYNF